ncbi:ATP-dependent helicase [Aeromicrobium sp. SMF47]|uniref:ATP-dependent helicase n=1 Tax=Aeromicrobium yanjiei TaxID=2662028 RepID=A0A5Q2MKI2_9ACTN|nr:MULTISPECIES: DEAD/DEAH box helicase [Aeromicrobium]MRJ76624.1 ATP-dependent helicase [Aeromicrobium yanjiei]MRK00971.1 ATP-dependent helicase [Aeromicrobium sp. S22]QGG42223.1 ATP-dependent helicase [Aeromicrobium yanjiei]
MARRGQRQSGSTRTATRQRTARPLEKGDIIRVLARAVREVEAKAQRGPLSPSGRTKFQVVAVLVREERNRVKADKTMTEAHRAEQLKRLDGVATILAQTVALDPTVYPLLDEHAVFTDAADTLRTEMLEAAGIEQAQTEAADDATATPAAAERRIVPQSVIARQLANPFLAPDFSAVEQRPAGPKRLATWELLGPLFRAFEYGGASSCMPLPEPGFLMTPGGLELMPHQAQVVAAAAEGHRTFLLADEPGLGKTAQALLAAHAADAYPLLVVVPNVVKTNWAREAEIWTPNRKATVIQGDGDSIDGFADIVIVNYEVLDRHVGWLGDFGFRGMVVDEAHFIKNKSSQRSKHALELSERIRSRTARPLLMALTGTPLINDIEDFRAIWQFLGWIDDKKPLAELMDKLEETGLTPADKGFYSAARNSVISMGIVRRRKVDVAADIPARRIADLPVELDDVVGRSIREAEQELARRLVARYDSALETRTSRAKVDGIDHELVRAVARWEREDADDEKTGENVFGMMRRIGQAKAGLAADYAAQLARNVGKVVFFAKHIDVMDVAEETFAKRGIKYSSIRGDQTPKVRQKNIDEFVNDEDVEIVVCSLTAAGVGLNLQVASNVVLAELSWTDAEQTQAIDRVHRIGQGEPVTAWRIIAAHTIDGKIAELIDSKAGLAARALDGSDEEVSSSADIQLEALVALLTEALEARA